MGVYPVADLAAYLAGSWHLDREITSLTGRIIGTFTGSATFTPNAGTLIYHEEGTLRFGSYQGPAFRTLHYHLRGAGQAAVYFDYGDFFHDLDLSEGVWSTQHPCRDDLYRGEFQVFGPDRWQQSWVVRGPGKNHSLRTLFIRA